MQTPWQIAHKTWIEHWGAALRALSFPQRSVQLSLDEAEALTAHSRTWTSNQKDVWLPRGFLLPRLDPLIDAFPHGAFVRLGSCSAKDGGFALRHGSRIRNSREALSLLLDSRRVMQDLRTCIEHRYRPWIFVREWVAMEPWSEFRCFMRNRTLVGISQYRLRSLGFSPQIASHHTAIESAIRTFFETFHWSSHLDDVIFDVWVTQSDDGWQVRLIELNPFHPNADPALFSWTIPNDFDGSFRYVTAPLSPSTAPDIDVASRRA